MKLQDKETLSIAKEVGNVLEGKKEVKEIKFPHKMYGPKGEEVTAKDQEEHEEYTAKGYSHTKPVKEVDEPTAQGEKDFKAKHKTKKSKDGDCNPLFFKPDEHMAHMEHMSINDMSYLDHMIPHHQVAIDMCHRLLLHTKSPHMMALCYDIIREQQNEILQMNQMLQSWDTWQQHSDLI